MEKIRYSLLILSSIILIVGFLALWSFSFSIIRMLGGVNLSSTSLLLLFSTLLMIPSVYILSYAVGKPRRRFRTEILGALVSFAAVMALGYAYDFILPQRIPVFWSFFFLPILTLIVIFYILTKTPSIRKKIDRLLQN